MEINKLEDCCGIAELGNIVENNPKNILEFVGDCVESGDYDRGAFLIFSNNQKQTSAAALAAFIKANKLGSIGKTDRRINPSSGNTLTAYIWGVDWKALKAWYYKNTEREDEDNNWG